LLFGLLRAQQMTLRLEGAGRGSGWNQITRGKFGAPNKSAELFIR